MIKDALWERIKKDMENVSKQNFKQQRPSFWIIISGKKMRKNIIYSILEKMTVGRISSKMSFP